jgi:spore coat protein U-like protein
MRHLAAMAAADAIAFNLINTTSYDCITRQCLTLRTVLVDNDPTSGSYRIIFYLGIPMKTIRIVMGSAALATALSLSPPAQAATASSVMAVSATVLSFCTIAALPLVFGNYSSTALAATTSVTVACTLGTTYNVGLDVGIGVGATVAARKMTFTTNLLNYGLYSDAGHTTVWGPTIATNTVTGTATGLPQILTVYGLIPAGQLVGPGLYVDTVTATITY